MWFYDIKIIQNSQYLSQKVTAWSVVGQENTSCSSWWIVSFQSALVSDATEASADADEAAEANEACAEDNADEERNQNPPVQRKGFIQSSLKFWEHDSIIFLSAHLRKSLYS